MFRRVLEIAKQLLPRLDRKERGVALAIFLLLQAMLPQLCGRPIGAERPRWPHFMYGPRLN